jgi:hypothetical protein
MEADGKASEVLGLRRVLWRAEIRGNLARPVREPVQSRSGGCSLLNMG